MPLQWAGTQNNLGNALSTLGDRESGTVRLEEAVSAYRAALEEKTRERGPLAWATSFGNLGCALGLIAERRGAPTLAREALVQIQTAHDTFAAAGHVSNAAYCEAKARRLEAIISQMYVL